MKKSIAFLVMAVFAACGAASAALITDATRIDRVGTSDTFTITFLEGYYSTSTGIDSAFAFLVTNTEPLYGPVNERGFYSGQNLLDAEDTLYRINNWDWLGNDENGLTPPYQGVQIYCDDIVPTLNVPMFSFTYIGTSTHFMITDQWYDESWVISVPAIPEPATLALLGLGGLLLRKRR